MNAPRRHRSPRVAYSLEAAIQACLEHALKRHNRAPKRLAELMGVKLDTLYKWIADCRFPANMIGSFEHACGATFLTQYLCAQAHLLAVEMPNGRRLLDTDVMELQQHIAEAMAMLIRFYKGQADRDDTVAELTTLMGEVGWHRANVERAQNPELELFGSDA